MASQFRSSPIDVTEDVKEEGDEEEEVELIEEPIPPSSQKRLQSSSSKKTRQQSSPSRPGPSKRPRTTPKTNTNDYAEPTTSDEEEDREKLQRAQAGPSNEDVDEMDSDEVDSLVGEVKPKPKRERKPKDIDQYLYDSDGEELVHDETYVMPRKVDVQKSKIHEKEKGKSTWRRRSGPRKWTEEEAVLFYRTFQKVPLSQPSPFQVVWYRHGEFGKIDQKLRQFHPSGHMNEKMKTILKVRQHNKAVINGNARRYLKEGHPSRVAYEKEREAYNRAQEKKRDREESEEFIIPGGEEEKEEEMDKDEKKKDKVKIRVSEKKPEAEEPEDGEEEAPKEKVKIKVSQKEVEAEGPEDEDKSAQQQPQQDQKIKAVEGAEPKSEKGKGKKREEVAKKGGKRKFRKPTPDPNAETPEEGESSDDGDEESSDGDNSQSAGQREGSPSHPSTLPAASPRILPSAQQSAIPSSQVRARRSTSKTTAKAAVPVDEAPLPRSTRSRSRMLESGISQEQQGETAGLEKITGDQSPTGDIPRARPTQKMRRVLPIRDHMVTVNESGDEDEGDAEGRGKGKGKGRRKGGPSKTEANTKHDAEVGEGGVANTQEVVSRAQFEMDIVMGIL